MIKNIYIISTDKPSRLQLQMNGNLHIENGQSIALRSYQNIYITSDEEIKYENYVLALDTNIVFKVSKIDLRNIEKFPYHYKKIILTTDPKLIKDGVQAIDDEFLEWFVKNPSCEEVEINSVIILKESRDETDYPEFDYYNYEIIIPKEEPKQDFPMQRLINIMESDKESRLSEDWNPNELIMDFKQETLEEVRVVKRTELYNSILSIVKQIPRKEVEGDAMDAPSCAYELQQLFLKWQQERSYSEEDLMDFGAFIRIEDRKEKRLFLIQDYFKVWFNQFKKK